ncbi:hypothetical protein BX600DRAFT_305185 [Xylariales sp. PMI_506]|nr:hypothetical protein BX600DRAFT_305185 [Xylariales sp. PMI_506]
MGRMWGERPRDLRLGMVLFPITWADSIAAAYLKREVWLQYRPHSAIAPLLVGFSFPFFYLRDTTARMGKGSRSLLRAAGLIDSGCRSIYPRLFPAIHSSMG